MTHSRRAW